MPVVEKTEGGRVYIRPLAERFEVGDQADVDDSDLLEHLTEVRGDFEIVDEEDDTATDDEEAEAEAETFDVGEFLDRTPVDDVVENIAAGEADGHLDEVAEEASRVTVQDAVGERRAELEG
ncbi:MAG: hypothetical protein ABEH81_04045 [Halopenitus sp.]